MVDVTAPRVFAPIRLERRMMVGRVEAQASDPAAWSCSADRLLPLHFFRFGPREVVELPSVCGSLYDVFVQL